MTSTSTDSTRIRTYLDRTLHLHWTCVVFFSPLSVFHKQCSVTTVQHFHCVRCDKQSRDPLAYARRCEQIIRKHKAILWPLWTLWYLQEQEFLGPIPLDEGWLDSAWVMLVTYLGRKSLEPTFIKLYHGASPWAGSRWTSTVSPISC